MLSICYWLLAVGTWHCATCGVAWRRAQFGAVACRVARCGVTWRRVLWSVVDIGAAWRGVVLCNSLWRGVLRRPKRRLAKRGG